MDAPRDDLVRSVPFELIRDAADGGDGRTLEGYAAVFGATTTIDSWEGAFDEVIAPGAFKRSINAGTPVLMFDHGQHPLIGSMPLGSIEKVSEDARGLYVRARLSDNWLIAPVRDAIAEGSISGMSFRFSVVRDQWTVPRAAGSKDPMGKDMPDGPMHKDMNKDPMKKKRPLRTLLEVKVPELGPVVFPAYTATSVGVRTQDVARYLGDPEYRAELARALLTGTASEPVEVDTPDAPATTHDPAPCHSRSREQRMAAARLIGVI